MPVAVAPAKDEDVLDISEVLSLTSNNSSGEEDFVSESSLDDDLEQISRRKSSHIWLRAATNRDAYGTWKHPLDFTLTLIGYVLGIHNFFRFPHMCYKYGALTFLIPYLVLTLFLGLPVIFMEITIGQFYGTGSATAFRQLAPLISGVGYILAWNSFLNTWIYGIMLTWTRCYSGDSLSCLRGWMGCYSEHAYNTPYCYTAVLDDCCAGLASFDDSQLCPHLTSLNLSSNVTQPDELPFNRIFYNYECVDATEFCSYFGWTLVGYKTCQDSSGKKHSIYERRIHAAAEYLYGFVLGMRRIFIEKSRKIESDLCPGIVGDADAPKKCKQPQIDPSVRKKVFTDPQYTNSFWEGNSQWLQVDPKSSSFLFLPSLLATTVIFITFFVFADLLSVSGVTYVMSTIPFIILLYICSKTVSFSGSTLGINDLLSFRGINSIYLDPGLWADAAIQVIICSGIGNGAMISLASFNKSRHTYLFDVLVVTFLNLVTSMMATFICFCSVGHYMKSYGISQEFTSFIHVESGSSSVDFGYYVYTYFLTIVDGHDFTCLFYFFMLSSFPTDTTIRLAQNMLDTAVQFLPRLRYHSTMALLATSFFFFVSLLPITRNGGILIFFEFEYCAHRFAMPLVTLIEVGCIAWVYKASRLMDDAQVMGVTQHFFRVYIIFSLKFFVPVTLTLLIIWNVVDAIRGEVKIHAVKSYDIGKLNPIMMCVFSLTPLVLFIFSICKQLASLPKSKWNDLWQPLVKWDVIQRRKTLMLKKQSAEHDAPGRLQKVKIDPKPPQEQKKSEDPEVPQSEAEAKAEAQPSEADNTSLGSAEIAQWKKFIFWSQIVAHFEDWPDRLDDSEVESEGSSEESSEYDEEDY